MDVMNNLERIGKAGHSRDVTSHPIYDDSQTVGPTSDFARDFLQGTDTVQSSFTEADAQDLTPPPPNLPAVRNVGGIAAQAVVTTPAPMFTVAQTAVGTASIRVTYPNPNRLAITMLNTDDTNTLYVGPNSATTPDTGFPIPPGSSLTIAVTAEIWGVSTALIAVGVIEYVAGE